MTSIVAVLISMLHQAILRFLFSARSSMGGNGTRIRTLRQRRGLMSKDLAERAGITPQSLSRIENGKHDVVFKTLQKLLSAMGYELKDLSVESSALENRNQRYAQGMIATE